MKKKNRRKNKGSILLETLLSMNIYVMILTALSIILLFMLHAYMKNLYQIELRAQMRLVAECMVQDIKHADAINIYQEKEHDAIGIWTYSTSSFKREFFSYTQDKYGFYPHISKGNQPLTGDNIFCDTYMRFSCRPLSSSKDNRVYLLEITGRHRFSYEYLYLETAVTRLGSRDLNGGGNES